MLKRVKKSIKNHPLIWRYFRNRQAVYNFKPKSMDDANQYILEKLNEDGIAFSTFNKVFPDVDFHEFTEQIYRELERYEIEKTGHEDNAKEYFNFVLGLNPVFNGDTFWNKIASHVNVKKLSDAYFGMHNTEMRYYNIWKHDPYLEHTKGSQLWHRDREDLMILKMFICVEDVDEMRGPFTYAPKTHLKGGLKVKPESFSENGTCRSTDEMMESVIAKTNWIKGLGKKGTVIFADTAGYHKGGEVLEGYRLLFTTMYVSPACERHYFQTRVESI